MKPAARSEGLLIQVVGTDTLIYDRVEHTSACLNALASAVWNLCDGTRTVEQIAAQVSREVAMPEGVEPVAVVWRSLDELRANGLLKSDIENKQEAAAWTVGRREMLKASAAAVSFPSVDKILAPTSASAASAMPTPTGTGMGVTASNTRTGTSTGTSTPTPSATATIGVTQTRTATSSNTPSVTRTRTPTPTRTSTATPTSTNP